MRVIDREMKKAALVWMLALARLFGEEQEDVFPAPTPVEAALSKARADHYIGEQKLVRSYRAKLAEILMLADAVEIYRLDFSTADEIPKGRENDFFPIKPYGQVSEILARKRLNGEDLDACRKATAELLKAPETWDGAYCHYPIHGVRFLKGKEVVFDSSFCWKCNSYYVSFWNDEEGSASWCVIASDGIQKFLEKQLPIPQSELDRFDKGPGRGKPADEEKK
jgi:hypothetical protein